jgi:hypothetical protein
MSHDNEIRLKDITPEDWAAFQRIADACHNEAEARGWHQPEKRIRSIVQDLSREPLSSKLRQTLDVAQALMAESKAPTHTKLMLMVTELAEACEFARSNPNRDLSIDYFEAPPGTDLQGLCPYYDDSVLRVVCETGAALPKPEGVPSELADVIIRIFDDARSWNIDIAAAMKRKMLFNATRPLRHGGKSV